MLLKRGRYLGDHMITENFLRGRRRDLLSTAELAAVEDSVAEVRTLPARTTVLKAGDRPDFSLYLIEGFMCRYMDGKDGQRQLVAVQVPGDFVDLHAYPLLYLDHDNATINQCTVGIVPHSRLHDIQISMPNLTRMLWFSTLLDAAMHREWIFRLGRLSAFGRVAHIFAETEHRLAAIGRVVDGRFALPLTQVDLAEACGITPVHLNRMLSQLRRDGLLTFRDGLAQVLDRQRLWKQAEFDPAYLY